MWPVVFLKDENYTPKKKMVYLSNQVELKNIVLVIDALEALHSWDRYQNALGDDEEYVLGWNSKYYWASELGRRSSTDLMMSPQTVTTVMSTSWSI